MTQQGRYHKLSVVRFAASPNALLLAVTGSGGRFHRLPSLAGKAARERRQLHSLAGKQKIMLFTSEPLRASLREAVCKLETLPASLCEAGHWRGTLPARDSADRLRSNPLPASNYQINFGLEACRQGGIKAAGAYESCRQAATGWQLIA